MDHGDRTQTVRAWSVKPGLADSTSVYHPISAVALGSSDPSYGSCGLFDSDIRHVRDEPRRAAQPHKLWAKASVCVQVHTPATILPHATDSQIEFLPLSSRFDSEVGYYAALAQRRGSALKPLEFGVRVPGAAPRRWVPTDGNEVRNFVAASSTLAIGSC